MNGWKLQGTFPSEELRNFKELTELDLSNNPGMAADLKTLFDGLVTLTNLQATFLCTINPFLWKCQHECGERLHVPLPRLSHFMPACLPS